MVDAKSWWEHCRHQSWLGGNTAAKVARMEDKLRALDRERIWRPYTAHEDHARRQMLVVSGAEGPWLIDNNGRRFLDGSGSWWCSNLGHGHPRLRRALVTQAERLMHCSFGDTMHESAVLLAHELVEVAPQGLERVFYSDDGSTSVEVATKMAFQYWQQAGRPARTKFLALPGGYHGDTIGAMSLGAVDAFSSVFAPLMFDVRRPKEPVNHDWDPVFTELKQLIHSQQDHIAAVVVEPVIQGAAGMRLYPPEYLRQLRSWTREVDTFLICDEVFTGFGRTGPMWGCTHAEVEPDFLCTAKGLSGGVLPFAATLTTPRVYDGFRGGKERAFMHGHTFYGNPLGAAVAREVLRIYRDENILEEAQRKATTLKTRFEHLGSLEGVHNARTLGMVGALEVGRPGYLGETGWKVAEHALSLGALLRPLGNTVYVVPPLNIEDDALDQLLSTLERAVVSALDTAHGT